VYVLELSAVRVVGLPVEAFHWLAAIGASSSLLQHAVRVVTLPLEEFHLLAVNSASVSFVQHFWHVLLNLEHETYCARSTADVHFVGYVDCG
jgi:hypothetical protein